MFAQAGLRLCQSLLIIATGLLTAGAPASAQDARTFYKGKTIKFIVSGTAGGGFESYARLLAPLISKELESTVVIQNIPGAGGLISINSAYNAPGDGLTITIVNGVSGALAQLVNDPSVRYELTKFNVLGLIVTSPWIWIRSPQSPLRSVADFMKPGVRSNWAGSGQMGGASDGAAITCAALALDCNIIRGYPGSAEQALALSRGEVDASYVSDTSARNYVDAGGAAPIITVSSERSRFFPDLPTIFDAVSLTVDQKWWFEFRSALDNIQRFLAMPPNTPKEQLALMREVVRNILTAREVIAEGERTQRYIGYKDPESVDRMIATVLASPTPEQKAKARMVILGK